MLHAVPLDGTLVGKTPDAYSAKAPAGKTQVLVMSPARWEALAAVRAALVREMKGGGMGHRDASEVLAPPFLVMEGGGLSARLAFRAGGLPADEARWAAELVARHAAAAGRADGADGEAFARALVSPEARYLVAYGRVADEQADPNVPDAPKRMLGFASFRFTLEGESVGLVEGAPTLYIKDVHVESDARRRGIARRLVACMEVIAQAVGMRCVHAAHAQGDALAAAFCASALKGYAPARFDALGEVAAERAAQLKGICVLSKPVTAKPDAKPATVADAPAPARLEKGWEAVDRLEFAPALMDEEDEEDEAIGSEAGALMDQLVEMFQKRHGRDPSEDEMAQWRDTLSDAVGEGFVVVP